MHIPEMLVWRSSGRFTDVVVQINGARFKCHRVALASGSKFFDSKFTNTYQGNEMKTIPLDEKIISGDTFKDVLEFIYTGTVKLTMKNVYRLLVAADFLKLKPQLERDCSDFLTKNLPNQHIFQVASFAKTTGRPTLLYHMTEYVSCNLGRFHNTSDFLELPLDIVKVILDMSTLREEIVVNAAMEWINHKCEERWRYFSQLGRLGMMACVPRIEIESMAKSLVPTGISDEDVASYLSELKGPSIDKSLRISWIFRDTTKQDILEVSIHHTVNCNISQMTPLCGGMKKVACNRSRYYGLNFIGSDDRLESGSLEFCFYTPEGKKLKTLQPPMPQIQYKHFLQSFHLSGLLNIKQIFLFLTHLSSLRRYDCDADEWHTIVLPRHVNWASMATCETTKTVYLIGGVKRSTFLQVYDCRSEGWKNGVRNPNHMYYEKAVTCVFNGKLYLYNESHRLFEIYDPSTNKWCPASEPNPHLNTVPVERLVAYGDELWLLTDTKFITSKDAHSVYLYRPKSNSWRKYPAIIKAMERGGKSFDFKPRLPRFLDAVVY